MNKEEMIQMLKDNPIKIIKCGDIEIPVEYLKQTTVNVNGDDYIKLQQENKQLKEELEEYKNPIKYFKYANKNVVEENKQLKETYKEVFNNYQKLKKDNETLTLLNIHQSDKIQQLKDNWNKLKEYLHNQIPTDKTVLTKCIKIFEVLDKMQELEQGSDSK